MVLHNADGSEAEISGNGIRCLAQAFLRTIGRDDATVRIETAAGLRVIESRSTDDPEVSWMAVHMGAVTAGPPEPPELSAELDRRFGTRHGTFSIGNPHLVITVENLDAIDIRAEGPRLESAFGGGINIHFLDRVGPDHLRLVHWERGAGATLACGSGASVSAVAARRWGLSGPDIAIELPGGRAEVSVSVDDQVRLSGPATYVGEVTVP
jgi:diaminopimelate epimerase